MCRYVRVAQCRIKYETLPNTAERSDHGGGWNSKLRTTLEEVNTWPRACLLLGERILAEWTNRYDAKVERAR